MRFALLPAAIWLVASCASQPVPAIKAYDSVPHYPVTDIPLSPSLTLRHVARAELPWYYAGHVLGPDTNKTLSTYSLIDSDHRTVFIAPSTLSDPRTKRDEWQGRRLKYDRLLVFTSASRHTILIIENGTLVDYRGWAYLLLRQDSNYDWTWASFAAPRIPRKASSLDQVLPSIAGLSDSTIWYHVENKPRWKGESNRWELVKERTWPEPLDAIKPGNYVDRL